MPDYYFRGTLLEYWRFIHAEWLVVSHGRNVGSPLEISHPAKNRPPRKFEEVLLEFLDDDLTHKPRPEPKSIRGVTWSKRAQFVFPPRPVLIPVTLRARSAADEHFTALDVVIEKTAYEKSGKSALARWKKLQAKLLKAGLLISSFEGIPQSNMPERPIEPAPESNLSLWFDWYQEMHKKGYKITLNDIAGKTGYAYGTIKQKHSRYMHEKGLAKPKKRSYQK